MSALIKNFAKAIDPAVKVVFNGTFTKAEKASEKICHVMKAEDYTTEMSSNVNVGMAELRVEQGGVNYQDFLQGDTKNLTQYTYDRGVKISKKLMKWNKLGQIKSMVTEAARSLFHRIEFDITKLIERGFDTTYTHGRDGSTVIDLAGGDAVALFSASHSSIRSSTAISNRLTDGTTVNMDFAEDALEAAETVTYPAITGEDDEKIDLRPDRLFISRKKSWEAMRLLKSTGRVGTPNNDINLIKGRYNPVELPYMDASYLNYFALCDSNANAAGGMMTMLVGSMAEHDGPYIDFDTKCIKHSWETELAAGHNLYHPWVGSKGTNAA